MRCSRCRNVSYCSKTCQRKAWPTHKRECTNPASSQPVRSAVYVASDAAARERASGGDARGALKMATDESLQGVAWWDRKADWSWAVALGCPPEFGDNTRMVFHLPGFGRAHEDNPEMDPLSSTPLGKLSAEQRVASLVAIYELYFQAQTLGDDRGALEAAETIEKIGLMSFDAVVVARGKLFLSEIYTRLSDYVKAEQLACEVELIASLEQFPLHVLSKELHDGVGAGGDEDDGSCAPGLWHPNSTCPRLAAASLHADALKMRGVIRGKKMDDIGAIRCYEKALAIYRHIPGEVLNVAGIRMNIGNRLTHQQLFEEAQAHYSAVRSIIETQAEEEIEADGEELREHVDDLAYEVEQNEGHLLMIQKKFEDAVAKFRKALSTPQANYNRPRAMHTLRLLFHCVRDDEQRAVLEEYNATAAAAAAEGASGGRARAIEPDTVCGVCLDPLMTDDSLQFKRCVITNCGHGVHQSCLDASAELGTSGIKRCPVCREQLNAQLSPIIVGGGQAAQLVA